MFDSPDFDKNLTKRKTYNFPQEQMFDSISFVHNAQHQLCNSYKSYKNRINLQKPIAIFLRIW